MDIKHYVISDMVINDYVIIVLVIKLLTWLLMIK